MKIFWLFLLLGLVNVSLAQSENQRSDSTKSTTKLGIHLGMNATHITNSNFFGLQKVGINALLYIEKEINSTWGWEADLGISQKGNFKPPNPKAGDLTLFRTRLSYADVIFWIRYQRKGIFYEAGLGLGYLLSHTEENESGDIPITQGINPFDAHLNAGVLFPLGDRLGIGFRLQQSFLPIRQSIVAAGTANFLKRSQLNQGIQFYLRYHLLN